MLKDIQEETSLNKKQIQQAMAFLKEYNLIIMDKTKKKIKLEDTVRKFLTQTATP